MTTSQIEKLAVVGVQPEVVTSAPRVSPALNDTPEPQATKLLSEVVFVASKATAPPLNACVPLFTSTATVAVPAVRAASDVMMTPTTRPAVCILISFVLRDTAVAVLK